jgi:hypothetical protein
MGTRVVASEDSAGHLTGARDHCLADLLAFSESS